MDLIFKKKKSYLLVVIPKINVHYQSTPPTPIPEQKNQTSPSVVITIYRLRMRKKPPPGVKSLAPYFQSRTTRLSSFVKTPPSQL